MKLTTKRLILREFTEKDIGDLIRNINDLNVSRYLLLVPYPYTLKDAKSWISHCRKEAKKKPRKSYNFCIELNKEVIGGIGLTKVDRFQGTATLGYWLGKKYWRKGVMSEALKVALKFGFKKLKLRRINVEACTRNKASNELLKKFNFKKEGLRRKYARTKSTKKIHDAVIYGLLKEKYKLN